MKRFFQVMYVFAFLCVMLIVLASNANAAEIIDSGFVGNSNNLGWTLDSEGTLSISGNKVLKCDGTLDSYSNTKNLPTVHSYDNGFCTGCNAYEPAQLVGEIYQIGNAGQLYWFAQQVNDGQTSINGKLTANITVNTNVLAEDGTLNTGTFRAWTPIGNYSMKYAGDFDGDGKTVSGLYFENKNTYCVGLFGTVNGGTVKNVGVIVSYLYGDKYVGGVVGHNSGGTVSNCYNTGAVSGSTDYVGGVVGYNYGGTVSNCYNTGAVSDSTDYVGGVVGYNYGSVSSCCNTGDVSGNYYVGGVVGWNNGSVSDCYNTGAVSGSSNVGGVVGYNNSSGSVSDCSNSGAVSSSYSVGGVVGDNSGGTVSDCYNTGTVSGSSYYVGGVVSSNDGTVSNCYNTGAVSGSSYVGGVVGYNYGSSDTVSNCYYLDTCGASGEGTSKTAAQFASGEVAYLLQGDQTKQIWGQKLEGDKDAYPVFSDARVYKVLKCDGTLDSYSNTKNLPTVHSYDNGFCTNCKGFEPAQLVDDYYQIGNAGQLYWFAQQVNGGNTGIDGKLTADIVVNENVLKEDGFLNEGTFRAWTPIGNDSKKYTGTFDGNGKTVSGLYVNEDTNYVGLFGYVNGGTVENVGVIVSYLYGDSYVGGVVGYNNGGTVSNCYNNGAVSGSSNVGGVVGYNNSGCTVSGCSNTGDVSSSSNVGGVVGYNNSGCTVSDCYNTGDVSGSYFVGGVVSFNDGTVSNCYNTGAVSGSSYVGGVVNDNYGTVSNCYNTGTVSGSSFVGGAVSWNSGTVSDCYNTGAVSGSSYVGGVVGYNYGSTVSNCYNTGAVSGGKDYVGGVVGWHTGTVSNCYYDSTVYTGDAIGVSEGETNVNNAEGKTTQQFASGEVAYLLQSDQTKQIWGQNIDNGNEKQTYPVFSDARVYKVLKCDGTLDSYSNTKNLPTVHSYDNGFCTGCNAYEPAQLVGEIYQIGNAGQLYWFAQQVNDGQTSINGKLTADIVVKENVLKEDGTLNTGTFRAWTPIGNSSMEYTGTFDGDDHTVSGLYFENTNTNYVGLFGYVNGGTVKNVGVIVSYLYGNSSVGGVVGHNSGGTVSNCCNTGDVSGSSNVGGVVGCNSGGTVSNCSNTGAVSGIYSVGGVVGFVYNGTVSTCYNTGTVYSEYHNVGGVVGENYNGTVSNCYNTGTVSGSRDYVGGVVGANSEGTVSSCYNSGAVSGGRRVGGVVGANSEGTVSSCYYLSTCGASGEGTAKTAEQFASGEVAYLLNGDQSEIVFKQTLGADDYPNFTGEPVYQVTCVDIACYSNSNADYAEHEYDDKGVCVNCGAVRCDHSGNTNKHTDCTEDLICSVCDTVITPAAESHSGGTATCTNPAICSVCGLSYGEVDPSSHDFTDNGFCPNCNAYEPAQLVGEIYQIGNAGQLYWFAQQVNKKGQTSINGKLTANIVVNENVLKDDGTLNGDGSDFRIWTPIGNNNKKYTGTFDGNGKTVSGLYFNNSSTNYVGLFGYVNGGTVKNVGVVDSYISGSDSVGGVVGRNYGTVSKCHNTGAVSGSSYVGGVVGDNYRTVSNCYNTGTVSGSSYVGGVVSDNNGTGSVSKCHNTGTISGFSDSVGGVVSRNYGTVSDCYNTGTVSGSSFVGGVVSDNYGTVSNCYNTGTVSGSSFVGGAVSWNSGTVSDCYNTGAVSGSSYVGGVVSDNNGTVSNCYYLDTCGASGEGTSKTAAQFKSGEVAYLLNGDQSDIVFKQTLGADDYPNFTGEPVYQVTCGGTGTLYSNAQENVESHTPATDDGDCTTPIICTHCQAVVVAANSSHTPGTDDGDCTTPVSCINCDQIATPAISHNFSVEVATIPATCAKTGTRTMKCSSCNQTTDLTLPIDPENHNIQQTADKVEPTCEGEGKTAVLACANGCGKTQGGEAIPATSHSWDEGVISPAPTCIEPGKMTYTCGNDPTHTKVTEIPANGEHKFTVEVESSKVPATCMAEGTVTMKCSRCEATEEQALPMDPANHTGNTHVEGAKTSTCGETGYTGDTVCECGKTITSGTDIPATGEHKFMVEEEGAKVPATCMTEGTVTMKCSGCDATEEQTLPVDPANHTGNMHVENSKTATCGEIGYTGDTVCECGKAITSGTVIPATGKHQYDLDEGYDASCTATGLTIGSSCHVCGFVHLAQTIVPALGHEPVVVNAVAPTCTNTGLSEGSSCGVCGEELLAQTELPMIDHIAVIDPAVESTCTQVGLAEGSHCASCGKVLVAQEPTQEKNHTVIIDLPKDPTCTESGLKGNGMHCDVCKTVLLAQEEILPLGHSWKEATCIAPKTCLVCDTTEGAALGHIGGTATCKAQAVCAECGQTYGILGEHAYGDLKPAQAEVHSKTEQTPAVAAHYVCDVCNTYFTENKAETTLAALTGETPTHSYGAWVTTDAVNHWKVCVCGLKAAEEAHVYDGNKDTDCNICGHERILDHEHTFATTWSKDENYHWYAATCGHEVTNGMEAHDWSTETYAWNEIGCTVSGTCIGCGYTKQENVVFAVVDGVLTMNYVPVNLTLMIAGYTGGQMNAIQMVDTVTGNVAIDSMVLNCSSVKIFFLSKTTYAPMCVSELVK